MSGGSWNYAYSKVWQAGEDLIAGEEDDFYCMEHYSSGCWKTCDGEKHYRQHPLRVEFGMYLLEVAEVMQAIEWSDSGDFAHDAWIGHVEKHLARVRKVDDATV